MHNPSHPLSQGLVSHLILNEFGGVTAFDVSGNGNSGTLTGPTWVHGQFGSAIDFDGSNDYLRIADKTSLDTGDIISVSMWFRRFSTTPTGSYEILFTKGEATLVIAIDASGDDKVEVYKYSGGIIAPASVATSDTDWHHLVVSKKGAVSFKIVLDGVDRTGTVTDKTLVNSTFSALIGADVDNLDAPVAGTYFKGQTDDIRIYNRALPDDETLSLYTNPYTDMIPMRTFIGKLATVGFKPYWATPRSGVIGAGAI